MTFPPGLLLVTDRRRGSRSPLENAEAALHAGFAAVMVREKDLPGGVLFETTGAIAALCRHAGALCVVNDRLDVALALEGVGAHVGVGGLPVRQARRLLGPERVLGYSAHEPDEARRALDDGADYVTLSPVFDPTSKPGRGRGLEFLEFGCDALPAGRVVALGGVTASRAGDVRRAGAGGAAVLGAVADAPDPAAAARALVDAWNGSPA